MTDDELDAIEDAARAAIKAQAWVPGRSWVAEAQRHVLDEYIAAVGPHVMIALVADLRRLQAERDELHTQRAEWEEAYLDLHAEKTHAALPKPPEGL